MMMMMVCIERHKAGAVVETAVTEEHFGYFPALNTILKRQ